MVLHREYFALFPDEMFADLFTDAGRRPVPTMIPAMPPGGPPRLVVLNLCSWPATTYGLDLNGVESLICWPDEVDDEQGRLFSRLLHGSLAKRRTVRQAFDDARRTVCDKWPALESPDLHGRDDYLIF